MTTPRKIKTLYRQLRLPSKRNRPYFFTNFVQTVDGVVRVKNQKGAYWPIGSASDFATLLELRAHADVLVHGRNTALASPTLQRLAAPAFQKRRRVLGKNRPLLYVVVATKAEGVLRRLATPPKGVTTLLVVPEHSHISVNVVQGVPVQRLGRHTVPVKQLSQYLHAQQYRSVLVEGGPHLITQHIQAKLLDELFLTIAPKLFGNEANTTVQLTANAVFPPQQIPKLELLSQQSVDSELFLRYRLKYPK